LEYGIESGVSREELLVLEKWNEYLRFKHLGISIGIENTVDCLLIIGW
jgi:hypothetical protein